PHQGSATQEGPPVGGPPKACLVPRLVLFLLVTCAQLTSLRAARAPLRIPLLAPLHAGCAPLLAPLHTGRAPLLAPLRAGLRAGLRGGRRGSGLLCLCYLLGCLLSARLGGFRARRLGGLTI